MRGLKATHNIMTWDLYLKNHSCPLTDYVEELERMSGLSVSTMNFCRQFQAMGPFKATMRETSSFPCRRDSWSTYHHLYQYLDFVVSINNHQRFVFSDKKLMKEVMIYTKDKKMNDRVDIASQNGRNPKNCQHPSCCYDKWGRVNSV